MTLAQAVYIFMFRYILYRAITQWQFDRLKLENGLIQ